MSDSGGFLTGLLSGGSAIVGFWFARWLQLSETRARALARLQALRAEIHECGKRALNLAGQEPGEQAMSAEAYFALPDWVGREAIGSLTADGLISEQDAATLVEFYGLVADINRNLDFGLASLNTGRSGHVGFTVARIKAGHIVHREDKPESLYTRTESVVSRNIDAVSRWSWYQPFLVYRRHR